MSECIFCRILGKELPCDRVYEDEDFLGFLDIRPKALGHTLLIPKVHCRDLLSAPEGVLGRMLLVVRRVAKGVMTTVGATGFRLVVNNGEEAGQEVFHLHFHIIPHGGGGGELEGLAQGELANRILSYFRG